MPPKNHALRLGVNLDHIATVRNARGTDYPDPIRGAIIATQAGADNITLHLREDRRHIRDDDLQSYKQNISLPLNMEMAATEEMLDIALTILSHTVTLVPENRAERTTEGGLNVSQNQDQLKDFILTLEQAGVKTVLFIEPDKSQIDCAKKINASGIEIHTGLYANLKAKSQQEELTRIDKAAHHAVKIGLQCHAGHGLTFHNVGAIAKIKPITELNIGHFLISEAIFTSLKTAIETMRHHMDSARMNDGKSAR